MNSEVARFAAYKPLEITARLAGKAGVAGVLVGSGDGYFAKLGEGFTAVPDFVGYVPNLVEDAGRVVRLDVGLDKAKSGARALWTVQGAWISALRTSR